jgi:predicted nucleic acid-binding protein
LDASAIINICSREEIEKIEGYTSNLAIYEAGNAIWKQVYQRRKISVGEAIIVLEVLYEIFENLKKLEMDDTKEVLKIAVNEGLTFYDASYIYLAVKNNLTLVTDDDKLYRVAERYVKVLKSKEL